MRMEDSEFISYRKNDKNWSNKYALQRLPGILLFYLYCVIVEWIVKSLILKFLQSKVDAS